GQTLGGADRLRPGTHLPGRLLSRTGSGEHLQPGSEAAVRGVCRFERPRQAIRREMRIYRMNEQQVLHSPFDMETHKNTFINYLEVVIDADGTIMYAVPSHQEKLIRLACERHGLSRDELNDLCPQ